MPGSTPPRSAHYTDSMPGWLREWRWAAGRTYLAPFASGRFRRASGGIGATATTFVALGDTVCPVDATDGIDTNDASTCVR